MLDRRGLAALLAAALLVPALSACGGGSDDSKLEQARAQGARQERERQRQRDIVENQKRLQRELDRLKRQRRKENRRSGGAPKPTPAPAPAPAPAPVSGTDCGNGLRAGPNTSCAFADVVRSAYESSDSPTVDAFSPVTGKVYTMTCTGGSPHVCTGGNNASVSFP